VTRKTGTQKTDENTDNDIQAIGHQIGSLASVLVVAMVQFGVPLTPGQQSSILSMIAVLWALFATLYGIRHRVPARRAATSRNQSTRRTNPTTGSAPTSRPQNPQLPAPGNGNGARAPRIDYGPINEPESGQVT